MDKKSKIYVAGHRGMVGSAIVRALTAQGFKNLILRTHKELDLTCQADTERFFQKEKPEYVFLAAARVGGILANSTYKADFIYENLAIATNIIHSSYKAGVKKLLNLGSTCIYPKLAPQPMKEESLLTGLLEPTNEPYAIAKIAAIKLCRYFNEQYGTNFLSVMPTNLYGPNDNYDFEGSHVLPALIRKFHLAKLLAEGDMKGLKKDFAKYGHSRDPLRGPFHGSGNPIKELEKLGVTKDKVTLWGTGAPYREFLYADDLADACLFLMQRYDAKDLGEFINIGAGKESQLKELAQIVKKVVGFEGSIAWDPNKPNGSPRKLSDPSRLGALGWKPRISLQQGLEKAYQDYLS